ncbi:MAG: response regulator transcription factor [Actinobacteria bacterium]|nr:MAG: response regulator transcription factor [Actinomycetota bacterium]
MGGGQRVSVVADSPRTSSRLRVLVVDDDEVLRDALCGLLSDEGFDVVGQAGDGDTAVCMARDRQPDVVLVDYRMPGMDGIEAIGLMKMEAPLTQAVMLTVYDDHALNLEAERAQVYCLLVKGCPPPLIVDMVGRAGTYKRELERRQR